MKIFNLFLNYSCNAHCGFCFNPPDAPQSQWVGMSTRKAMAALMDAHRDGYRVVSFIGGEVTVRGDFLKLVAAARRIGFTDLRLVTNGFRLAEADYAESLLQAGLSGVFLSIHASQSKLHDRLMKVPGAYDKALKAMAHLQRHNLPVGLNIVVNKLNYKQLPEMAEHFARERGVRNFSFFSLRYIGHMGLAANLSELKVSMAKTAPFVRRALEVLEREGCRTTTSLGDFVPCILPGYETLMTDWESGCNPDRVSHPDGKVEDSDSVCSEGKRLVEACGKCAFKSRCLGVNDAYLAVFGEKEFKPVLAKEGVPA